MAHHGSITDVEDLHQFYHWLQSADPTVSNPGEVVNGQSWLDTTGTPYTLKVRNGGAWVQVAGSGSGVDSVNGLTGVVVLDPDDLDDTSTTNKFADATSVDAAGATMNADTTLAGNGYFLDEDDMSSNSATKVPSQQSVKAYVDAQVVGGGYTDEQAQDSVGNILTDSTNIDFTYNDAGPSITADLTPAAKTITLPYVIDGGGSTITTGIKGDLPIFFDCTIIEAWALADQSGSIVVDIWKDTYANFPPVDADSITASAPVTISSATKSKDTTLTGWTTSITADDILRFNVDSVTSIQRVTIALKVRRT